MQINSSSQNFNGLVWTSSSINQQYRHIYTVLISHQKYWSLHWLFLRSLQWNQNLFLFFFSFFPVQRSRHRILNYTVENMESLIVNILFLFPQAGKLISAFCLAKVCPYIRFWSWLLSHSHDSKHWELHFLVKALITWEKDLISNHCPGISASKNNLLVSSLSCVLPVQLLRTTEPEIWLLPVSLGQSHT